MPERDFAQTNTPLELERTRVCGYTEQVVRVERRLALAQRTQPAVSGTAAPTLGINASEQTDSLTEQSSLWAALLARRGCGSIDISNSCRLQMPLLFTDRRTTKRAHAQDIIACQTRIA